MSKLQDLLRERYEWSEVEVPRVWRPRDVEELIGFCGGRTVRQGQHGQYEVVLVHVPSRGAFVVSGTVLIQLIDASMIQKGDPVRIVYLGTEALGSDRTIKRFRLFIAGDERDVEIETGKRRRGHRES